MEKTSSASEKRPFSLTPLEWEYIFPFPYGAIRQLENKQTNKNLTILLSTNYWLNINWAEAKVTKRQWASEVAWKVSWWPGYHYVTRRGSGRGGEGRPLDGAEFQGRWLWPRTQRKQELRYDRTFFTWDFLSGLVRETLHRRLMSQGTTRFKSLCLRLKIPDQLKVLAELCRKEKFEHSLWISSYLVWRRKVKNHLCP